MKEGGDEYEAHPGVVDGDGRDIGRGHASSPVVLSAIPEEDEPLSWS